MLRRGDQVRLLSTGECGVVVHAWRDEQWGVVDCYVAFFGEAFPEDGTPPSRRPYVLRYAETSLGVEPGAPPGGDAP